MNRRRIGRAWAQGLLALSLLALGCFVAPGGRVGLAADGSAAEVVSRAATQDKVIALTFDAGSDAGHTVEILDILEQAGVKATFFLTADWLANYPELGAAIVGRGHAIGNHTKSHPHLTTLTDEEILAELQATEDEAQAACGRTTKPFFRPPFGEYDDRVQKLVGEAGYDYMVLWTVDSLDWKMIPADELIKRVVDNARPGAIVLMHVGSQTNEPQALPEILRQLKEQGYRFATLTELLLGEPPEGATVYTVKAGDTLYSIARRFGVSVDDIVRLNNLKDANAIEAGMALLIPPAAGSGGEAGDGDRGSGGGTAPSGDGGDQGGYGSDEGGSGSHGGAGGFLGRVWAGLVSLWRHIAGFFGRLIGRP